MHVTLSIVPNASLKSKQATTCVGCSARYASGGQAAGGHPKAFPRPRQTPFAVPAFRELEIACRVSISWDAVTVPMVCFSGVLWGVTTGSTAVCDPNPPWPFAQYRRKFFPSFSRNSLELSLETAKKITRNSSSVSSFSYQIFAVVCCCFRLMLQILTVLGTLRSVFLQYVVLICCLLLVAGNPNDSIFSVSHAFGSLPNKDVARHCLATDDAIPALSALKLHDFYDCHLRLPMPNR